MPQTWNSSPENKRYNDESNFLDGFYEFHPEFFNELNEKEREVIRIYYLTNQETPENVFEYRYELIQQQPGIEELALKAFKKLLKLAGMDKFEYRS